MAKKKSNKKTSKKTTAGKRSGSRKKVVSRKKATKKTAAKKAVVKKKSAKKAVRKAAPKTAGKSVETKKKPTKKTVRKTVRKPAHSVSSVVPATLPAVAVPEVPVKLVSPLNKKELGQFRELLLIKRAQLVGDVSALQSQALSENRREAAGDLSSMPIHMADLGTDNYEKEFTLGLIESERTILREIDEALARIDDGTYGVCEATGQPIGKARLKAQPWVKYCYEYMLAQEKGQQSSGL